MPVGAHLNKLFHHKEFNYTPETFDPTIPYKCWKCNRNLTCAVSFCSACGSERPVCSITSGCRRLPWPGTNLCHVHGPRPPPNSNICQFCTGRGIIVQKKKLGFVHDPRKPHEMRCEHCLGTGYICTLPPEMRSPVHVTTVVTDVAVPAGPPGSFSAAPGYGAPQGSGYGAPPQGSVSVSPWEPAGSPGASPGGANTGSIYNQAPGGYGAQPASLGANPGYPPQPSYGAAAPQQRGGVDTSGLDAPVPAAPAGVGEYDGAVAQE